MGNGTNELYYCRALLLSSTIDSDSAIDPHLASFQVQLLVSDSDVKSYKQIKDDLDGLRLLVEKSELWVFKSKSVEEKTGKTGSVTPAPGSGPSGPGQAAAITNGVAEEDEGEAALQSLEEKVDWNP